MLVGNTLDLARPIVAGCVNSNATCKKYGDDLIEFISAQLVSNANNKAQQAEIAAQQGFDAFTSTLLYSKYQNHESIIQEAEQAALRFNAAFLYRDFRPFWWDGIGMSKELGIYRQKWCGCILSMKEAALQQKEALARKMAQKAERAARLAAEDEERRKKKAAIAARNAEKEQKRRERLEAKGLAPVPDAPHAD